MTKYTAIANDDSYWKNLNKKEKIMNRNISPEMQKEFQDALKQALKKAGVETTFTTTYSSTGNTDNGATWYAYWGNDAPTGGHFVTEKDFIPTKIIYSCPATICFFPDGTKEIVRVTKDEEYIKEVGVMSCIMKKMFDSRRQFVKLVASGTENEDAEVERVLHNASVENVREENLAKELKAFTQK